MVHSYMRVNNRIEVAENQVKDGRPGRTWLKSFMKRNKLSLKKASMIYVARKSNTSNPFIIYDFFDKLEEILQKIQKSQQKRCGTVMKVDFQLIQLNAR